MARPWHWFQGETVRFYEPWHGEPRYLSAPSSTRRYARRVPSAKAYRTSLAHSPATRGWQGTHTLPPWRWSSAPVPSAYATQSWRRIRLKRRFQTYSLADRLFEIAQGPKALFNFG